MSDLEKAIIRRGTSIPRWYVPLIEVEKPEQEGWSIDKREQLDRMVHEEKCAVCKKGKPKLKPHEFLFGVKNVATRDYLHAVATSSNDAVAQLGWDGVATYVIQLDSGTRGSPMSEETKRRLREINASRRSDRPPRPKRIDPRHEHICPECKGKFIHTSNRPCDAEIRCMECDLTNSKKRKRGIDTPAAPCYNDGAMDTNQKGGDNMEDLKSFVKAFLESQVMEKDEKDKIVLVPKKLFQLAKANGLDVAKYEKTYGPETAGRARMTIGNMLRGAAVRNGKLTTIGGASKIVPEAMLPKKKEKPAAEKKEKKEKKKKAA